MENNKQLAVTIASIVVAAMVSGGGTYAYLRAHNNRSKAGLQSQIDILNGQLAAVNTSKPVVVATPVPTTSTPLATPLPPNLTDPAALSVVNAFENDYIALGKDPNNNVLRHKLLYDYFVTPSSQAELDLQQTLDGKGSGGPVLFGSASASTQLQSYTLDTDYTDKYQGKNTDPNVQFIVMTNIVFNGSQGNTQTGNKTITFHLTKASGKYLIDQFYNLITGPTNMFNAFYN